MRRSISTLAVVGALALGLTACGTDTATVDPPAGNAAESSEAKPSKPAKEEQVEEVAAETGTRENPAAAGSTITLTDWTVVLGATNRDASAEVAAENQFNSPPAEGRSFVMVPITATYTGTDTGTAWLSIAANFVGNAGNTYGDGMDDYCGVIPGDLTGSGDLYEGATATGNVCVQVPTAEIEGGTWVVENRLSFDGVKAFVALQ